MHALKTLRGGAGCRDRWVIKLNQSVSNVKNRQWLEKKSQSHQILQKTLRIHTRRPAIARRLGALWSFAVAN
jgi:hypothetical protein